ncbi:EAL domain-containing response regulator [Stenotrophomonas rhizophila]|uniref:EAL domain-containing response regulator n=1 Tax=Stenotrophomonas rhizophila TaxID=216778 RepID=UPI00339A2D73
MTIRHVLILEDQAFQRSMLAQLFNSASRTHADTSGDGADALAMCHWRPYDLVVTDMMMPGVDGIQFIQSLAAQDRKPALVLVSSASTRMMFSARLMAESLGFSVLAVLPKPVSPGDVADVMALLSQKQEGAHRVAAVSKEAKLPLAASRDTLWRAMKSGEITAWFQPKKSLGSGLVVAAEALVRWCHPEQGLISPGQFLPLIQENALELALLRHMVKMSVLAQAQWRARGFRIPVSVNLPPHLLERSTLPEELAELTIEHGGSPADLCFELMESSTTRHVSDYYAGACRLRMKGFGLAQDDFGQGLSSVHNLVSAPFTEVKIDRSLVHGCTRDSALRSALSTVITLGQKLGLNIVAEGVETDEELSTLRALGCTQVQGYLISAAIPADAFAELLNGETRAQRNDGR